VVYGITCLDCNKVYIGQTGRRLTDRLNEHKRAVNNKNQSNAVAKHVSETNHQPDFNNIKIVQKEKNIGVRILLESYTIAANATRTMNLSPADSGMIHWLNLFRDQFPDVV